MKKYRIWLRNGSIYEKMTTIEAESHAAAIGTAASLFGRAPIDIVAWASNRNPNDGDKYDRTAKERQRRKYARRQAAVQDAEEGERIVIGLGTPLPCAVFDCKNTATVAHAWRVSDAQAIVLGLMPGVWFVQPICGECTRKTLENYTQNVKD